MIIAPFGTLALAASLLAPQSADQPTPRTGWNAVHATLAAGSAPSPTHIALARGIAIRDDLSMRDGTIEVDIAPPGTAQFAGIAFRVASAADYEIVYLSAAGGRWTSIQYQPLFQGEPTWQLYPGAGYLAELPSGLGQPGKPIHVRLVFAGRRADLFVDDAPVLRIPELKRAPAAGAVGVWAGAPRAAQVVFDRFAARANIAVPLAKLAPAPTPSGQIIRWRVSSLFPSPDTIAPPMTLTPAMLASVRRGRVVRAEAGGLVNLSREVGNPAGPQTENVFGGAGWGLALARVVLTSDRARTVALHFDYSDGLGIFLDGRRRFAGEKPYASFDLGRVHPDANRVDLVLHPGRNELILAVTDKAFGWGFVARLEDPRGIVVDPSSGLP